jgi:flagellar protein FliL
MSAEKKAGRSGIFVFALVLGLIALGAFLWRSHSTEAGVAFGRDGAAKGNLHLEPFVLNLADSGQRSYLRVGIDLGLGREVGRGEDAPPVAQVRDTILGVLSESRVDDLLTAKGKAKLKDDLLRALQERVPELKVEEVYFTEFLIQR